MTNDIYQYRTPKLGENGACSITHKLEEEPYDLRAILGGESLETTKILQNLSQKIQEISQKYDIDWMGVYQKRKNLEGELVLVKLAYIGEPSRAEFPLNETFAKFSNNSTVGLTGKEIIVQNVGDYSGPYYQCDAKVKSELCAPLLGKNGEIIGIMDAESFQSEFFRGEVLESLRKFCQSISEDDLPH